MGNEENKTLPNYAISDLHIFFKKGKIEIMTSRSFTCVNEGAMRRSWRKNSAGRKHRRLIDLAGTDQVPLFWISYFN